jgi:serpin B
MKHVAVLLCLVPILALPARGADPTAPSISADVQTLVQGNNAFALDLASQLRNEKGNLFYSPYSISTALGMTYAGARGETAEQMARVLHFTLDSRRLHPGFAELIRELNGHGLPREYQLNVAQSLWGDAGLRVRPEFQNLVHTNYGARLRVADFRGQPNVARRQINRWVEQRTNDKIKELLHERDIDELTRMVLVNAIYFKAAWQSPFLANETQKDAVFHAAGKELRTALMRQTGDFRYGEGEGFQVVELRYAGEELSMVVLLPREKYGLGKLEQSLTAAKLTEWLSRMNSRKVTVELPRFKLQARFDLAMELKAMGMPLAFNPDRADFSAMEPPFSNPLGDPFRDTSSGYPYHNTRLFISKVIHQAFVDVNEEGTEAAAATAVVLALPAGPPPETPVVFRADHPFLFLVRDHRTGSILFLGRVADPSATGGTGKE